MSDVLAAAPLFLMAHLLGILAYNVPWLLRAYPVAGQSDLQLMMSALLALTLGQVVLPKLPVLYARYVAFGCGCFFLNNRRPC